MNKLLLSLSLSLFASVAVAADAVVDEVVVDPVAVGWTFEASAALVYMLRDDVGGTIATGTNSGATLVSASDLSLDWAPGADIRLGAMNSNWGVEGRFYGGFNWDSEYNTSNAGLLIVYGVNVGGASALLSSYESSFDSAELNAVWRPTARIDILGGVRWVDIDEQLDVAFSAGGPTLLTATNQTSSQGYGPQIGAKIHAIEPGQMGIPAYVDIEARIGAIKFDNESFTGFLPQVGNPIFPNNRGGSEWSAIVEVGAVAGMKVTDSTSLEFGYRMMYLDKVAVAASGGSATVAGDTPTDHFLMHGFTAGLKVSF